MPIYEFECTWCGNVVEKFYPSIPRVTPEHIAQSCDPCGDIWSERKHTKILSKTSFKLEGMGWAVDGYDKNAPYRIREIDEPSVI
jgi:predicted nucleic acid-binding Zn ribbon protein